MSGFAALADVLELCDDAGWTSASEKNLIFLIDANWNFELFLY